MNTSLKGKRIFIVEDSAKNRAVYQMILGFTGADIKYDHWGTETLLSLQTFKPDIIIMDLMLPEGISGFDIFAEIRRHPEYEQVPIVAISAADPNASVPKCHTLGFAGFIAKPIETELLPDQLRRLLAGEQVWYMGERYGGEIKEPQLL